MSSPYLGLPSSRIVQFIKKHLHPLPYDAEVEYIESTGTQYIDTGISMANNLICEVKFCFTGGVNGEIDNAPFGANAGRMWLAFCARNQSGYIYAGTCTGIAEYLVDGGSIRLGTGDWHVARIDTSTGNSAASFAIEDLGVQVRTAGTSSVINLYLFGCNGTGISDKALCRVAYCKIIDVSNGLTLLDIIPVRFTNELGQSEGAMYDRVSGQLFRNAGTGTFIVGADTDV